jgi:hypothetical protein
MIASTTANPSRRTRRQYLIVWYSFSISAGTRGGSRNTSASLGSTRRSGMTASDGMRLGDSSSDCCQPAQRAVGFRGAGEVRSDAGTRPAA